MPIESVVPACSAPADRLSLSSAAVRGDVRASFGFRAGQCFADDEASPSFGMSCISPMCFAGEE